MASIDFTPFFRQNDAGMFYEQAQMGRAVAACIREAKVSDGGAEALLGTKIRYKRRPIPTVVTQGSGITDWPAAGAYYADELTELEITDEASYGADFNWTWPGMAVLTDVEAAREFLQFVRMSVDEASMDLNRKFLAGVLSEIGMSVGRADEPLFQRTDGATATGAPHEDLGIYPLLSDTMDRYGTPRTGRRLILSNGQRALYGNNPFMSGFNTAGPTAGGVRNGDMPPVEGITTFRSPASLNSVIVGDETNFGYADEAAAATAVVAGAPEVRDLTISITAAVGVPLDLKEGHCLYFTATPDPLSATQRERVQGYVVAADTPIAGGATVAVPITKSLRINPDNRQAGPDISVGMYLRGHVSHAAGIALHENAIDLVMARPWPTAAEAPGIGGGMNVGHGMIADKPFSQGGTGLSFWFMIKQLPNGVNIRVAARFGWHVVRQENVIRVVSRRVA
jgi:hypothetical protein